MSFHFSTQGPSQEIADHVRSWHIPGDSTQLDMAKEFISSHLDKFPGVNHVTVSVSGRHDGPVGTMSLTIGHTAVTPGQPAQDEPQAL